MHAPDLMHGSNRPSCMTVCSLHAARWGRVCPPGRPASAGACAGTPQHHARGTRGLGGTCRSSRRARSSRSSRSVRHTRGRNAGRHTPRSRDGAFRALRCRGSADCLRSGAVPHFTAGEVSWYREGAAQGLIYCTHACVFTVYIPPAVHTRTRSTHRVGSIQVRLPQHEASFTVGCWCGGPHVATPSLLNPALIHPILLSFIFIF